MTSMTGYMIRVACYLLVGHYIARYIVVNDWQKLSKFLFYAVVFQLLIAFIMLLSPDFKRFFSVNVAGFSGSSKFLSEDFFGIRNFGWSLELFYTGPVAIVMIATLLSYGRKRLNWFLYYFGAILVAIINARIAIVSLPFLFYIRYGMFKSMVFGLFFLFLLVLLIFSLDISLLDNFKAEFQGGRSRTLDILLDSHVQMHLRSIENFTGLGLMVYSNSEAPFHSDIGWIIALHYGGWIFLCMMIAFFYLLSVRAFRGKGAILMAFLMLIMLGVKGPVFAGNGVIALFAIFASMGGYDRRVFFRKKDEN
ncbi:hypothetical protein HRH59_06545 [Rheinheimera sp. YQF-2]|uniref:O-antigen ligase domain-containing protein n=1 Tax=Rheinheimera lutimaris TaxID=2740584 RepID=A0A7Y5EIE7_9GAMM|nr:hypothetical protein [Rheinheimera lutimaris]NRQ42226.1 hypothetical protein [Rheinheimera lutimaris]